MEPLQRTRNGNDKMLQSLMHNMGFFALVLVILVAATYRDFSHPPGHRPTLVGSIRLEEDILPCKWEIMFAYFNGFSFFSAVCGLLVSISCGFSHLMLPIPQGLCSIEKEIAVQQKRLAMALPKMLYAFIFLMLSIACCVFGYVCAGLTTARKTRSEQLPVIVTFAVGCFVCLQAFFVSVKDIFELWREICESHSELWFALKNETLFGMAFTKYVEILYGIDSAKPPKSHEGNGIGEVGTTSTKQKQNEGCYLSCMFIMKN